MSSHDRPRPRLARRRTARRHSRTLPGFAILTLSSIIACGVGGAGCASILGERFAVNAPIAHMLFGSGAAAPSAEEAQRLRAPEGFGIGQFATELPNVRFLRFTETGDLLASLPRGGRIVRLEPDRDGDGRSDGVHDLLTELDRPHGLDLHEGWLYVGEGSRVFRVRYDANTGLTSGQRQTVAASLPDGGNHWTRTARVGPDGFLYVSVGSSCNVCEEGDPRRAAMLRFPAAGGEGVIYASGLRNSVGFDWHPTTGALYATDNGRDLLGDDFPPCELNRIEEGGFYGWPYLNGPGISDPDFGGRAPEKEARAIDPAHSFQAHNAPLGITFVRSQKADASLRGAALVALHGSWNRTSKDGYKVVSLHWGAQGEIEERDFLSGFEIDDDVIGRPVDVAEGPDGAFYVSDDYAGTIYRVAPRDGTTVSSAPSGARTEAGHPLDALAADERGRRGGRGGRGLALWQANGCAGCHDPDRQTSGVVAVPLRDLDRRYTLRSLERFLAAPTPPMPVPPLDAAGRRDLAVFLLSRSRVE